MTVSSSDHAAARERFVADLLDFMELKEKIGQLVLLQYTPADHGDIEDRLRRGQVTGVIGSIGLGDVDRLQRVAIEETRLGIPLFIANETGRGEKTVLPAPIALAASWDDDVAKTAASIAAGEARANGTNWAIGPEISLCRSTEDEDLAGTHGTSPYLAERLATSRIIGMQANGGEEDRLIACLRVDEAGWSDRREDRARSQRLRLILSTLRNSRPGSVALDREAAHRVEPAGRENDTFSFLSRPGGYEGIVLSEWNTLATLAGQSAGAMPYRGLSVDAVAAAVRDGRIPAMRLDDAVRRVLGAKFDLGLFRSDSPRSASAAAENGDADPRDGALDAARKSIVLLRNYPALLPLTVDSGEILVVGTAAVDRKLPVAPADGEGASIVDGLDELGIAHKYVPGLALRHQDGGTRANRLIEADRMAIGMAGEAARKSRTVVMVLGDVDAIGEAHRTLLEALAASNDNIVLVTLGAKPLDPRIGGKRLPTVLHAGLLGSMSGHAIAQVLSGDFFPRGKLPFALEDGGKTLLPLGHGLSYSQLALTEISVEAGVDRIVASGLLSNAGDREATETVQLYTRRSGTKEKARSDLANFKKETLHSGDTQRVSFEIGAAELGDYDLDGRFVLEPGDYEIALGLDAKQTLTTEISLSQSLVDAMIRLRASGEAPAMPDTSRAVAS